MAKMGRPTLYTPELAERICQLIATNAMSMKRICSTYKDLPDDTTIYDWLVKYPDFSRQYFDAKEAQASPILSSLWEELDKAQEKLELEIFDRKFRFHQWHLSKLAPKRFGDTKKDDTNLNVTITHEQALRRLAGEDAKEIEAMGKKDDK